jgi:hypothetical protein
MERRCLILGLLAVAAFAQIHTAAAQSTPFPRLGAYLIGGTIDYANLSHIGNLQVAVFAAYPGYTAGGKNLQQQVAAVKALNPNMKITVYAKVNSANLSLSAYQAEYNAASTNNWWLRSGWPSGTIVTTFSGTENDLNLTVSAYRQWMATFFVGFETVVAPNLDGIFTDNFYQVPRESGDYLRNGTTQSYTDPTVQQNWRNGYAAWDAALRSAMGSQYMDWGNVAGWNAGSMQGYNQLLNGGVMESTIGEGYSPESSSWAAMMTFYATVMKAGAPFNGAGPYFVFQQDGAALSSSTYQAARYGLTSCLLDNGYYHYNTAGQGGGNNVAWLDEMGVSLGGAVSGPNNPANGTYSNGGLTVWKQGVWRRDFTNGIALVNPKGNGPQTVTLETNYEHFSGTQDPSLNNGQSVTSVTLNDRDGVILLRTAQMPQPDAPTLSVQ